MKKTKRYNAQGYVTNDDSNSGMKEAYDADQLAENFDDYGSKKGAGAAGTSESTTEEAGGAMLKAMRDKESAPKAKPAMPALGMNDFKAAPSKPKNPNFSNEGRSTPAPAANTLSAEEYKAATAPKSAKAKMAERDAEMAARRERTMGALKSAGSFLADLPSKAIENYKSTVPRYNKEKKMASGGKVSSASSRGDGIASKGKTRGKMIMCGGGKV